MEFNLLFFCITTGVRHLILLSALRLGFTLLTSQFSGCQIQTGKYHWLFLAYSIVPVSTSMSIADSVPFAGPFGHVGMELESMGSD